LRFCLFFLPKGSADYNSQLSEIVKRRDSAELKEKLFVKTTPAFAEQTEGVKSFV